MSGSTTQGAGASQTGGAQTLSIADIYWNGVGLDIKDGASLELGGLRNAPVMSTRKVFNAQKMEASKIRCSVIVQPGMNIGQIFGTGTGELQVQCDTGQSFVWDDAFIVGSVKLVAKADGSLDVEWNAGTPTEL
jgi:hypothetical protein